MGRDMQSKESDAATIFYPCMQAADIFQMRLDLACAGIDQRKAHILAREAGGKLGWGETGSPHTPPLVGLAGGLNTPPGRFDEGPQPNPRVTAKKTEEPKNTPPHV